MVKQVEGLLGTKDLTEWEESFVDSIVERLRDNPKGTLALSSKQVEVIERIYGKHFA
jgi:hypothetical protein